MAYDNSKGSVVITLEANADLSSKQYHFVEVDSNGKVGACNAATDRPIGVLQNKPSASGQAASVLVMGVSKIVSDAALDENNLIGPSADGQADKKIPGTDTSEFLCGTMLTATGGAGEIGTAVINCASPARGA
mgnify:CR=1 FL=1|tara:strand:+ start:1957 stop:2355 length:399 start_codon:yes stop_codon:yes gene_type:complete